MAASSQATAVGPIISLEELRSLPVLGFILWTVQTQRWTVDDFRQNYGALFPIEEYVDLLRSSGLLNVASPYLTLTDQGRSLLIELVGAPNADDDSGTPSTPVLATGVSASTRDDSEEEAGVVNGIVGEDALSSEWLRLLPDPRESPWNLNELLLPEYFIGRHEDLTWLRRTLITGRSRICALYGDEGIGKTALAAVAVRLLLAERAFSDGIAAIWCDHSQSHEVPRGPGEILGDILSQLYPHGIRPVVWDVGRLVTLAHEQLWGRNVLIVLDHVDLAIRTQDPKWRLDRLVAMLQLSGAAVLLISTAQFPEELVPRSVQRRVGPLAEQDALALFAHELTREGGAPLRSYERRAGLRIVRALKQSTLAVKLVGRHAAAHRDSLCLLADDLQTNPRPVFKLEQRARTSHLPDQPMSLDGSFQENLLSGLSHEVKLLFAAFAAFHTVEFSWNAVLSVGDAIGLYRWRGSAGLDQLLWSLIKQAFVDQDTITQMPHGSDRDRLRLHVLLATFSRQRFALWTPEEQKRAVRAVASYYLDYVGRLQQAGMESALYFDKSNIAGVIEWAKESGEHRLLVGLCHGMRAFWYNRWYTAECERYLPWAVEVGELLLAQSESQDVLRYLTELEYTLAQTLRRTGKLDEAEEILKSNLRRRNHLGDQKGAAATLAELGVISRIRGKLRLASQYIDQSLRIRREVGDHQGEGYDLSQLARIRIWQGAPVQAQELLEQSLDHARATGDRRTEAADLIYLGQVARERSQLDQAEKCINEGLVIMREVSDLRGEAVALHQLGQVLRDRGDLTQARERFIESLAIRRRIGDRRGEGEALGYLGRIARTYQQWPQAEDLFNLSLAIAREVGDRRGEGIVLSQLGRTAWARGKLDLAKERFKESLAIRKRVGDFRGKGADLGYLGRIALQQGNVSEARRWLEQSLSIAKHVDDRVGEGYVLVALAMLKAMSGDLHEGRRLLQQARRIVKLIQSDPYQALFYWEIGRFLSQYPRRHDYGQRCMRKALTHLNELGIQGEDVLGKPLPTSLAGSEIPDSAIAGDQIG